VTLPRCAATSSLQAISRGITKGGVAVETLNLELCSLDEVTDAVKRSKGFVLGERRGGSRGCACRVEAAAASGDAPSGWAAAAAGGVPAGLGREGELQGAVR
jgi:hypothetical protein